MESTSTDKISQDEPLSEMGFFGHFDALRSCLFRAVLAIAICTAASFTQIKILWRFLLWPLPQSASQSLQNIAPTEVLVMDFKVSILAGILIASPVVFWQAYRFFAPALFAKERKMVFPVVSMSVFFFVGGAAFAFFIVLPASFQFLHSYSEGITQQQWTQSNYLGFIMRMILAFAMMFQLPVITYLLAKLKLVNAHFLMSQAKIAVVVIFVLAAILTPPEVISQLMLAVPLVFLYGFSILIAMYINPEVKDV